MKAEINNQCLDKPSYGNTIGGKQAVFSAMRAGFYFADIMQEIVLAGKIKMDTRVLFKIQVDGPGIEGYRGTEE